MVHVDAYVSFDTRKLNFYAYSSTNTIGDDPAYLSRFSYDIPGDGKFRNDSVYMTGADFDYNVFKPVAGTIDNIYFMKDINIQVAIYDVNISISDVQSRNPEEIIKLTADVFSSDDRFFGSKEADHIDGFRGADQMYGGKGNDTFVVDNLGDRVHDSAVVKGGIDTVLSSVNFKVGRYEEIEFVQTTDVHGTSDIDITGSSWGTDITGNAGSNKLTGKDDKDTLRGQDGNDVLIGGFDQDMLIGGHGDDVFVFHHGAVPKLAGRFADHIKDFNVGPGDDMVALSRALVGDVLGRHIESNEYKILKGNNKIDADDRLIYDQNRGLLYLDANGNKAGDRAVITYVDNRARIEIGDFDFVP